MDDVDVINKREELRGHLARWMSIPLDLLAVALLAALIVDLTVELSPEWRARLDWLNWFIYFVFTVYFLVQLALAPDKVRYIKRNPIAALSVLLPAVRVVRVLRTARALRGLRLARALAATNRGTRTRGNLFSGHQFGRVLTLTVVVVLVGAAALLYFEEPEATGSFSRYGGGVWWSTAFVTTVGSTFQPQTLEGRVITLFLIVWGPGVFVYITGSVASYFVGRAGADRTSVELRELRLEMEELRDMLASALERPEVLGRNFLSPAAPSAAPLARRS